MACCNILFPLHGYCCLEMTSSIWHRFKRRLCWPKLVLLSSTSCTMGSLAPRRYYWFCKANCFALRVFFLCSV